MNRYAALLRGINVGGNNIIKMTDLAACFKSQGFQDVITYIQSGNVLFRAEEADQAKLTGKIEEVLSSTFHYTSSVVLRSEEEIKDIVTHAPDGFGGEPAAYRYDVLFLKQPLTAADAISGITPREGVDQAFAGNGVLYFSRLISRASQSYLTKIIGMPIYQSLTIRNWNTTTKLLAIMEG